MLRLTDTWISELAGTMQSVRSILPFTDRKLRSREGQGFTHGQLLEVLDVPTEFNSVEFYFLQRDFRSFPQYTKTQTDMVSKCIAVLYHLCSSTLTLMWIIEKLLKLKDLLLIDHSRMKDIPGQFQEICMVSILITNIVVSYSPLLFTKSLSILHYDIGAL